MRVTFAAALFAATAVSSAAPAAPPDPAPVAPPAPEAPKPPPYSLPWQLRSVAPATALRIDEVASFYTAPSPKDATVSLRKYASVTNLIGTLEVGDGFVPLARLAVVATPDAVALANPVVGGTYVLRFSDLRLGFWLGLALPLGSGGGDSPDAAAAAAMKAASVARSVMEGTMFSPNDFSVFPGVDFAYVGHGLTVQVEATVLELIRVKGSAAQKDTAKTNFTSGLHVGYFLIPQLSLGAELRYQRWLTTPAALLPENKPPEGARDNLTFAGGLRGHIKLGETSWVRPGVAYARGLDKPMSAQGYNILQVDVPFTF